MKVKHVIFVTETNKYLSYLTELCNTCQKSSLLALKFQVKQSGVV